MRITSAGLMAVSFVLSSSVALAAADPALTCESSKLKISAKYGQCRLNAESKGVKTNTSPDYSKCSLSKFTDAETKAGGACPTTGDQPEINQRVTYHTDALAELLAGGYPVDPYFPASGQTTSYGAGDDGDVQAGAALAYIDNGDGTITDRNTGLMWEKKVQYTGGSTSCTNEIGTCANPHDGNNRYTWTVNSSPYEAYNGTAVTIFLDQLNNRCDQDTTLPCTVNSDCAGPGGACGFAGHRDWRLPQIKELVSIVDYSIPSPGPTVNAAFNGASCGLACTDIDDPTCSCTAPNLYWSASTDASYPAYAWLVYFYDGYMLAFNKNNALYVRAVRGGS